jgi:hypothetical protein
MSGANFFCSALFVSPDNILALTAYGSCRNIAGVLLGFHFNLSSLLTATQNSNSDRQPAFVSPHPSGALFARLIKEIFARAGTAQREKREHWRL